MYCRVCGAEFPAGAQFCAKCETKSIETLQSKEQQNRSGSALKSLVDIAKDVKNASNPYASMITIHDLSRWSSFLALSETMQTELRDAAVRRGPSCLVATPVKLSTSYVGP